jgi:hypothetical protein
MSRDGRFGSKRAVETCPQQRQLSPKAGMNRRVAMKIPRRLFLHLAAVAVAIPAVTRIATAQIYPARPMTMIVPFAAGGGTDVLARIKANCIAWLSTLLFMIAFGCAGTAVAAPVMRCVATYHSTWRARIMAGLSGFLILSQCRDCPD